MNGSNHRHWQLRCTAKVIDSEKDLLAHDPHSPACVWVTAALVRPVFTLVKHLYSKSARGELARALELLLVGFDEDDSIIMEQAARAIVKALFSMGVLHDN